MTHNTAALHDLTVAQLAAQLRERKVSAVETAQHFLARARANASLGAFLDINEEVTLAQARAADVALAAGTSSAAQGLLGVPVAHKDIFVTRDFVSTAGSKMLAGYRSPFDATVVAKLAEQDLPLLVRATGWLSDHLNVIAPVLAGVIGLFVGWKIALAAHAVVMGLWSVGSSAVTVATTLWTGAQWLLNIALDANPIGLLIIAIAALIVIAVLVVTHWSQVSGFFAGLWGPIVGFFRSAWNTIGTFLSGVWTNISTGVTNAWNGIANFFRIWGTVLAIIFTGGLFLLVLIVAAHWKQITDITTGVWNAITGFLGGIWSGIATFAKSVFDHMAGDASTAWGRIQAGIINPIAAAAGWLGGIWNGIYNGAVGAWNNLIGAAASIFSRVRDAIMAPFAGMHIPMPHLEFGEQQVNVAGAQFTAPKIDVKWYAQGGIFTKPTMLGNGSGVGDAGPEAAAPISELAKYLPHQDNGALIAAISALPRAIVDELARDTRSSAAPMDKTEFLRLFGAFIQDFTDSNKRGLIRARA